MWIISKFTGKKTERVCCTTYPAAVIPARQEVKTKNVERRFNRFFFNDKDECILVSLLLSLHSWISYLFLFLSPLLLSFAYKHAPADVVTAACQTRVRKTRQGGRWLWCVCDGGRGEGRYTTRGRGVRACCRAPLRFPMTAIFTRGPSSH